MEPSQAFFLPAFRRLGFFEPGGRGFVPWARSDQARRAAERRRQSLPAHQPLSPIPQAFRAWTAVTSHIRQIGSLHGAPASGNRSRLGSVSATRAILASDRFPRSNPSASMWRWASSPSGCCCEGSRKFPASRDLGILGGCPQAPSPGEEGSGSQRSRRVCWSAPEFSKLGRKPHEMKIRNSEGIRLGYQIDLEEAGRLHGFPFRGSR